MKLRIKYPNQRTFGYKVFGLHGTMMNAYLDRTGGYYCPGSWRDNHKAIGKYERWLDLPASAWRLYSRLHPRKEGSRFSDLLKRLHKLYK